nr:MAG TPA: hypothetical protein [Microviridae sp.]
MEKLPFRRAVFLCSFIISCFCEVVKWFAITL